VPIYEYRCEDCKGQFEKIVQRCDADAVQVCPKCKSEKTKRMISVCASHSALSASDAPRPCPPSG
jgi:putative FmdB family regulatory protein